MIKFANEQTRLLVRDMWKECFGDTDEFLDILFQYKYKDGNTLLYFDGDKVVASLQMLSYTITFYGQRIPFAYLAGLCTLPEYRNKGYMPLLIHEAHRIMADRNIPLAILIPAEDWLYHYYERFGYEQVFETGTEPIYPIQKILETYPDLHEAYQAYDAIYKDKDFCVQKDFDDFMSIVKEQKMEGFPTKYNLPGMARIIDPKALLNLYAGENADKTFSVKIKNACDFHSYSSVFRITDGSVECDSQNNFDIETDFRFLCRLLFGYKTNQLSKPYKSLFAEHHPIMNQMLE